MRSSIFRVALIAASLLAVVGASAATSSGSRAPLLRAIAPKLIAHDTTSFRSAGASNVRKHATRTASTVTFQTVYVPSSAMGISQMLVGQNGTYEVYSRALDSSLTPIEIGEVSSASFWAGLSGPDDAGLCATSPQGEPSIAYDWLANRWVLATGAFAGSGGTSGSGPFVECVAVSTSPDATGAWNRYVFQVSSSVYPDRPSLGVWGDGYYLSFDQLTASGGWAGAGVMAFQRSAMLAGSGAQARYFDLSNVNPGLGGMQPADVSTTTAPTAGSPELYLQAHDDPNNANDRLEVWSFHVDWTSPVTGSTFQPLANLPLPSHVETAFSCLQPGSTTNFWSDCIKQEPLGGVSGTNPQQLDPESMVYQGSNDQLPVLGGRLQWVSSGGTQTLAAVLTGTSANNQPTPVWFELTNSGSGWSLATQRTFDPGDTTSRYLPSVGIDGSGNIGLAYEASSTSIDPTLTYTEASSASPTETALGAGSVPFTASDQYGRYPTMLSLDPVDTCTFWLTGPSPDPDPRGVEYFWLSYFKFADCTASASQPPEVTADSSWTAPLLREGQTITGNTGTFSGATSTGYQWQRCNSAGLDCVDISGATSSTYAMSSADAAGDRTLRFKEIGTNANGSADDVSIATTLIQSLPPVNTTLPVISGTADAGDTLTTTNGTWTSSSPLSFTYRWRRCSNGTCANIAGAVGSTYTLTPSDVGSTVDVVVSATNTGGGSDANAVATGAVGGDATPTGPTPDLQLTAASSSTTPGAGSDITLTYTVYDKNAIAATGVSVTVSLPTAVTYSGSYVKQGTGCIASSGTQVICSLGSLAAATSTTLQVYAKVQSGAKQTITATASSPLGDASPADNTALITLNGPVTSTPSTGSAAGKTITGVPVGLNGPEGTATADKTPPTSHALPSTAKRGRVADLKFRIYDNSGYAKAVATVKRGAKQVARAATGFGPVAYGTVYYVGWHVPKKLSPGKYSFCVVAYDRAKHQSKASCAALTVH